MFDYLMTVIGIIIFLYMRKLWGMIVSVYFFIIFFDNGFIGGFNLFFSHLVEFTEGLRGGVF